MLSIKIHPPWSQTRFHTHAEQPGNVVLCTYIFRLERKIRRDSEQNSNSNKDPQFNLLLIDLLT